jgi:hypothetical protein
VSRQAAPEGRLQLAVWTAVKTLPLAYRHPVAIAGVIARRPSVEAVLAELADLEQRGLVARTPIYHGAGGDPDRVLYDLTDEGRARC